MSAEVQTLHLGGKTFVVMEVGEYERLRATASMANEGPPLPPPSAEGLYPAAEYGRASLARKLIARRRRAGWSVTQLARKAKVAVSTVQKLEDGSRVASVSAVEKIDRALRAVNA